MLNNQGFDLWANNYDKSVSLSEDANKYPFAGYRDVLNTIYQVIRTGKGTRILDVGFGTGVLTQKLYQDGCSVWGIDFSAEMIAIAQKKMPGAVLLQHDFSQGLPSALTDSVFDFIVCTYAIHHLAETQKIALLRSLTEHLAPGGKILIGDVAFETAVELEKCRVDSGDLWDSDELYPVAATLRAAFPAMQFQRISFCAGVLTFCK